MIFLALVVLFLTPCSRFPLFFISMAFFYDTLHTYVIVVYTQYLLYCFQVFFFSFLANSLMSPKYFRWLIFSCIVWSLHPSVHYLNMRFSCIIITNSNGDSASPRKIPLWIFSFAKLLPFAAYSTLQFVMIFSINVITSLDILNILGQLYNPALWDHIVCRL